MTMAINFYSAGDQEIPQELVPDIKDKIEELSPSDLLTALDRNRPYNGQPWTDIGTRGKQEIHGITMRDIRDCFIRACYDSNPHEETPASIHDINFNEVDIMAVCQNMIILVEKYMGIFPNIPESMKNK